MQVHPSELRSRAATIRLAASGSLQQRTHLFPLSPSPTFCATPVMPTLLLPIAPTLPAVCVPCPAPDASPKL